MAQQEKVVDENLNKFLDNDLPETSIRNVEVDQEEFEDEATLNDKPITNYTKQRLLHYLRQNSPDVNDAKKLVTILGHIDTMTESQAQRYLLSIQHITAAQTDSEIVNILIRQLADIFFNPQNSKIKEDCIKDRHVIGCATNMMMDLFGQIGSISGALVFIVYAAASWYKRELPSHVNKLIGNNENNQEENAPS